MPSAKALHDLDQNRFICEPIYGFRIGEVPCDGCTRCCRGDAIRLLPGDDANEYITEPHDHYAGQLMLAHKADGDCIYLGSAGCTIHDRRPLMCREMDCRMIALNFTFTEARKTRMPITVWHRGKELLKGVREPVGRVIADCAERCGGGA